LKAIQIKRRFDKNLISQLIFLILIVQNITIPLIQQIGYLLLYQALKTNLTILIRHLLRYWSVACGNYLMFGNIWWAQNIMVKTSF